MNNTTILNSKNKFVNEEDLVKNSSFKSIKNPKPLIKWAGGKTQIIEKIIGEFPNRVFLKIEERVAPHRANRAQYSFHLKVHLDQIESYKCLQTNLV